MNDILGDNLLRLLHLVRVGGHVLERVLEHGQHDELEGVDELGNLHRPFLEAVKEVDDDRVSLLGGPFLGNLLLVKLLDEGVIHPRPRGEDGEDVEQVAHLGAVVRGDVEEALDQPLGLEQLGEREHLLVLEPRGAGVGAPPRPQRLHQLRLR